MSDTLEMKCRKCRYPLLSYPETRVESNHGTLASEAASNASSNKLCTTDVWYIPEEHMPPWMHKNVGSGRAEWVKGKINCPKCDARVGAFDFVSGLKCPCGLEVVTPVHIVKSKVDFFFPPSPSVPETSESGPSLEGTKA